MDRDKAILVGDYLKQQRKRAGLSARQLGHLAGTNGTTISRIEAGEFRSPRAETLVAVATSLNISVTDLFTRAGYITTTDLPHLGTYLKAMFDDVPHDLIAEIETQITTTVAPHLASGGRNHMTQTKPPTAVMYLRVSTSAQAETDRDEDGLSIQSPTRRLHHQSPDARGRSRRGVRRSG